jgi:hypothetical protein
MTVGVVAMLTGSAIMFRSGLGWIGIVALVGTIGFSMHNGFARARLIRRVRANRLETA